MKKALLFVVVIFLVFVAAGCGQQPEPEVIEPPEQVYEPPVVEPDVEEEPVYPFTFALTGVGTESTDHSIRPIMVMIENSPQARPQSGMHMADIVYEVLAEGNITRFLTVFQSEEPEVIGPVRSIRPYMIQVADGIDPVIAHAGWSPEAQRMLTTVRRANLNQVVGADHLYFWRSNERRAPHNLYTSIEKIREGQEAKQFREEWNKITLNFNPDDHEYTGEAAHKVKVNYYSTYHVSYEYDDEEGTYKRFMLDQPHVDKETDTQLTAHNIIIAETAHRVLDNAGRREIDVKGPGDGYLVQQGKVEKVTWETIDGFIRVFKDGEELHLVPGKTWINIVPIGSTIEIE